MHSQYCAKEGILQGKRQLDEHEESRISGPVTENDFHISVHKLTMPDLLYHAERGTYLLLHGHRQSGKSTHLEHFYEVASNGWSTTYSTSSVIRQHCKNGFIVIPLSFEFRLDLTTVDTFWNSLFKEIAQKSPISIDIDTLQKLSTEAKKVAFQHLFTSEYFKNLNRNRSMLYSFIGAGTFDITLLDSTLSLKTEQELSKINYYSSPFNITDSLWIGHFTEKDVINLLKEAAEDRNLLIDEVCWGKTQIQLADWKKFAAENLLNRALASNVFLKMIKSLKENNPKAEIARTLLWRKYLFDDEIHEPSLKEKSGLHHLLSIGVLIQTNRYKLEFSSTLIQQLIFMHCVIYRSYTPHRVVELITENKNIDIFKLIVHAVSIFRNKVLTAAEVQNKKGVAEYTFQFELFSTIRHILQIVSLQYTNNGIRIIDKGFLIFPEAKEKNKMRNKRLGILIRNGHKVLIKLKVEVTDYDSLVQGVNQAKDYMIHIDSSEAYLVILCTELPMHYNYQAGTEVKIIWIVSKDFTIYEIITVGQSEKVNTEHNRFLHGWS
ncbi:9054_t:CDS:2 [Funneliformis mosseae]|uniref:9054_t:CDS:1 n=1 Tax=Funneliformis mosseae TaxID=27381 RepID=A0A9N9E7G8_FUNMO|nr:9054_t:CDS:2 [Funneliformis mosseae]